MIAHDGKKQDMLKWCMDNKEILQQHNLSGTGTTARMIADHVGLKIKGYNSGPLGGGQQVIIRKGIVDGHRSRDHIHEDESKQPRSQQQIADFGIIAKIVLFQRNSFCV